MKITLDIPDGTVCAFWSFVCCDDGYRMGVYQLGTDDLYDGNTIVVKPQEENNG